MGNELVVDLAKANHPHVDWDQIAADLTGIILASLLLSLAGRWIPGRPWQWDDKRKTSERS